MRVNLFSYAQEADLPDAAEDIVYLDNVVQEALRMYPPAPRCVATDVVFHLSKHNVMSFSEFLMSVLRPPPSMVLRFLKAATPLFQSTCLGMILKSGTILKNLILIGMYTLISCVYTHELNISLDNLFGANTYMHCIL